MEQRDILGFSGYVQLQEDFNIENGKLIFDAARDKDSGIKSSFGKSKKLTPYKKTVDGLVSYSLYQTKTSNSTDILKALKSSDFNDPEVKKFLIRSAIYAVRILRSMKADVIVTPISSSDLTKEFVKEIERRTNYDVLIDSFMKRPDLSKVTIDKDHPKITDSIIKSMQRTLDKAVKSGSLSVKLFAVPHRKFLKNLFEVTDEKIYNKTQDKNVVIIDDVMTSGTTTQHIRDILITNQAESVSALTIFKSTS